MGCQVKLKGPISLSREGQEGVKPLFFENVIILAKNFSPSQAQLDVLNKGLTFIPTLDLGKDRKSQLQLDLQNYHRKLSLAGYFGESNRKDPLPFMPATTWVPNRAEIPEEINLLIEEDKKCFKELFKFTPERKNLTKDEVRALRELVKHKHIIIKPADKGSVVVIMGRDQYIREVQRQLTNQIYYKKLEEPMYLKTVSIVHSVIDNLKSKKFINSKQSQYLKGDREPRERRFYILPKIHKAPETWPVPFEIPPGRPIVSDCGSETYQTAEYIDYFLQPLSVLQPSYVKDTYHFIELVKKLKIPPNSLFFSMDVDNLYTNIDIKAGLATVKKIFEKYPKRNRPDEEVLQLLEINLTRNDFVFDGEFYLQVKGTAMGKRFAPAYANIFMATWEEEALAKCPKQPLHYLRYLDDIWGIWCHSEKEFEEFMAILNAHDPSIKLKHVVNQQAIDFLDTTVYKGTSFDVDGSLDIKVFFKETDTHALLFKSSFHPRHTFKGLVKSQLIRFNRICTQEKDFWEAVKILFGSLRKRGYSRTFLRYCLKSFKERKQTDDKEIIPFISSYSSVSVALNGIIKNNFAKFMENSSILKNHRVIGAYRKNKNLKDFLVRARLRPIQNLDSKLTNFCTLKYVKNRADQRIFRISQEFTPNTKNCVYIIFCSTCGKQYVGETVNPIRTRMWQHKYNIRNKKEVDTPLVGHFVSHGLQALKIAGLQSNLSWTTRQRKAKERQWIYGLQTKEPFGLNKKQN